MRNELTLVSVISLSLSLSLASGRPTWTASLARLDCVELAEAIDVRSRANSRLRRDS